MTTPATKDWSPITRSKPEIRGVHPKWSGLLDVRVRLSRPPPSEWVQFFMRPSGVSISLSMHPPHVQSDEVRLRPPDDEIEDYVRSMDERIAAANAEYEARVLPVLRAQAAQQKRDAEEMARRLDEARKKAEQL